MTYPRSLSSFGGQSIRNSWEPGILRLGDPGAQVATLVTAVQALADEESTPGMGPAELDRTSGVSQGLRPRPCPD